MKKKILLTSIIFVMILNVSISNQSNSVYSADPLMTLTFDTYNFDTYNYGGVRPDYGLYIAQYLRNIGIEIEVKVEEWVFPPSIYGRTDFDMTVQRYTFGHSEPNFNFMYNDHFWQAYDNYNFTYKEEFVEMLETGTSISSFEDRVKHYHELQEFFMDKILLFYPLVSLQGYDGFWSNTEGYHKNWGWVDSCPYMSYDGFHENQVSLDEFIFADNNWRELNPLFSDDKASAFIWDLMSEPLIKCDPYGYPTHNGLVYNWIQMNNTHYKFYIRPNVYWNPSYNITGRTASSLPLINTPLMLGLKGEFSNGTNQEITAKDAVFTLLSWANPITSENLENYRWLKNVYVDPLNPYAFHIQIDGDPSTPEEEEFSLLFKMMEVDCLPEFFLNSSIPVVSYTSNGIKCVGLSEAYFDSPPWIAYSTSAFGCGKFMIDYYVRNSVTVLRKNPYWFGIGAINGSSGMEPFVDKVVIRVIPDYSAELAEFKAGKLDITDLTNFPPEREQMKNDPRFLVYSKEPIFLDVLTFNVERPHLGGANHKIMLTEEGYENYTRSLAVRKAICHAIDRMEIADVLFKEYTLPNCPIPESTGVWYNYNIQTRYNYDIQTALGWLARAGYDLEAAGLVTPPTIPTSTFTFGTNTFTINFPLPLIPIIILSVLICIVKKNKKSKGKTNNEN